MRKDDFVYAVGTETCAGVAVRKRKGGINSDFDVGQNTTIQKLSQTQRTEHRLLNAASSGMMFENRNSEAHSLVAPLERSGAIESVA